MAFLKGSRYGTQPRFDGAGFKGVMPRPPQIATPVLEHTVAMRDRLDALAQEFYRNPRDWTRLAACNPDAIFAEDLIWDPDPADTDGTERAGHVILIPRRTEES